MQGKWWRERGFVIVAGAFVVVGVAAAVLSLAGVGDQDDGQAAPVKGRTTTARASDSACGMPAGDQRVPLRPPPAHWDKVGEQQAPGATKTGPGVVDGHVRRCYAHSPTGAVFAAYNFFALAATYNDDTAMLRELTAASAARDAALGRGSPPSNPNTTVELVGFRVMDYAPTAATVVVGNRVAPKLSGALHGQTGVGLAATTFQLRWERGDWKVVVEPGDDSFPAEPLDSLAGLVAWSAS